MASRGFIEIDAIVGIALLLMTIAVVVSALVFSAQGLNEKMDGIKQVQAALAGQGENCFARVVLENGELMKRCPNDIFN